MSHFVACLRALLCPILHINCYFVAACVFCCLLACEPLYCVPFALFCIFVIFLFTCLLCPILLVVCLLASVPVSS